MIIVKYYFIILLLIWNRFKKCLNKNTILESRLKHLISTQTTASEILWRRFLPLTILFVFLIAPRKPVKLDVESWHFEVRFQDPFQMALSFDTFFFRYSKRTSSCCHWKVQTIFALGVWVLFPSGKSQSFQHVYFCWAPIRTICR